jgi:hypothetical protein
MNCIKKLVITALLAQSTLTWATPPPVLITHNLTDVESNAYVGGTVASHHPTKAHADSKVSWTEVRLACFGRTVNGKCSALIKMKTNTAEPIEIGTVALDLITGEITPSYIQANGYTISVTGLAETTITQDVPSQ